MVADPATFGRRFRWLKTASAKLIDLFNKLPTNSKTSRTLWKALWTHPSELCSNIERVTWERCGRIVAGRFYGELPQQEAEEQGMPKFPELLGIDAQKFRLGKSISLEPHEKSELREFLHYGLVLCDDLDKFLQTNTDDTSTKYVRAYRIALNNALLLCQDMMDQRIPSEKLKYHVENLGIRVRWCQKAAQSLMPVFNGLSKNSKLNRNVWKSWYSVVSEHAKFKSALEDYMLEDLPRNDNRYFLQPPDFGFQNPATFTDVYYGNTTQVECDTLNLPDLKKWDKQCAALAGWSRQGRRRKHQDLSALDDVDKERIRTFCTIVSDLIDDVRSFMEHEVKHRRPRVTKPLDYIKSTLQVILSSL